MTRIRLVHWNKNEAAERIAAMEAAGHVVDFDRLTEASSLRRLRQSDPEVIVIDLTRSPARGRDMGLWLRKQASTRAIPLVFLGGEPAKVAGIERLLPDAVYSDWESFSDAIAIAVADPPARPVVPESVFAGYSGTPLPKKLGIKPGSIVALVGAPGDFEATLGPLPEDAILRPSGRGRRDLTLCFVRSRRELARRIDGLVRASEQGHVWIAWPKKSSDLASDLSQNEVRTTGLDAGLVDFKICAIDATWSGLCFALRRR